MRAMKNYVTSITRCYTVRVMKVASFLTFLDECVSISRPSQWVYTFLPFLLGALVGMTRFPSLWRADFIVLCLFFLWPANFLVFGLQEWFEPQQAKLHRKVTAEAASRFQKSLLGKGLVVVGMLFCWLLLTLAPGPAFVLLLWFFLVLMNFLPPLRLQRVPFFDVYSSAFQVLPAVVGYWWATLQPPSLSTIVAFGLWAAGWKVLFELLLASRKSAKERSATGTVAQLGESNSLLFLFLHWGLFAFGLQGYGVLSWLVFVYPISAFLLMIQPKNYLRSISHSIYFGQAGILIAVTFLLLMNLAL